MVISNLRIERRNSTNRPIAGAVAALLIFWAALEEWMALL